MSRTIASELVAKIVGWPGFCHRGWTYVGDQYLGADPCRSQHHAVLSDEDGRFWGVLYEEGLEEQDSVFPWLSEDRVSLVPLDVTGVFVTADVQFDWYEDKV